MVAIAAIPLAVSSPAGVPSSRRIGSVAAVTVGLEKRPYQVSVSPPLTMSS